MGLCSDAIGGMNSLLLCFAEVDLSRLMRRLQSRTSQAPDFLGDSRTLLGEVFAGKPSFCPPLICVCLAPLLAIFDLFNSQISRPVVPLDEGLWVGALLGSITHVQPVHAGVGSVQRGRPLGAPGPVTHNLQRPEVPGNNERPKTQGRVQHTTAL